MSDKNTDNQPEISTQATSATQGSVSKTKEEWPLVYEPGKLGEFGLVFNEYGPGVAEPRTIEGLVKGPATDGDPKKNKVPSWASVAYILLSRNPKPPVMGLNCIFRTALEWIPDLANHKHPESTQALRSVFAPSRKANIYFRRADSNTGNNGHHQIMEAAEEDPEAGEEAPARPRRRRAARAKVRARADSEVSHASGPSSKTMSSPIGDNKSSAPTSQDDEQAPSKKRGAKKAVASPAKKRKVLKAPPTHIVPQQVEEPADDWQVKWAGLTDREQLEMLEAAEMLVLLSQGPVELPTPEFEVEDDIYNASPPPSRQTRRSTTIFSTGL